MIQLEKMTVGEVCKLDQDSLILIQSDEDFSTVIRQFSETSELRGIFVVDEDRKLVGVITRTDLLDWTRVRLGSVLRVPPGDRDRRIRLINLITATTAGQVARPESREAAVRMTDSLSEALKKMIDLDLIVLPVVDEQERIVGDLKLSELLDRAVAEGGEPE